MILTTKLAIHIHEKSGVQSQELDMKALEEEFKQGLMRLYGISPKNILITVQRVLTSAGHAPFQPPTQHQFHINEGEANGNETA